MDFLRVNEKISIKIETTALPFSDSTSTTKTITEIGKQNLPTQEDLGLFYKKNLQINSNCCSMIQMNATKVSPPKSMSTHLKPLPDDLF